VEHLQLGLTLGRELEEAEGGAEQQAATIVWGYAGNGTPTLNSRRRMFVTVRVGGVVSKSHASPPFGTHNSTRSGGRVSANQFPAVSSAVSPRQFAGTGLESDRSVSDRSKQGGMEMRALLGAVIALTLVAGSPYLADAGKAEDATLTTKVKTKLTADRVKNLVSVNVDTKDGVVHLKGTVPNEQAKAEAERLAKDTDGVVSVTNDLKVSPPKK
jgi:hypothetical protein